MEILNVAGQPFDDTTFQKYEFHNYQPYIPGNINYNDEVRIQIQDIDSYTLPCNGYLNIVGKLGKVGAEAVNNLKFINNSIKLLLRELRYELIGIVIDSVRNFGLTSKIKNYVSLNKNEGVSLENAGWYLEAQTTKCGVTESKSIIVDKDGSFNVCITLKLVSEFFDDFRRIVVNMRQQLVLVRSSNDKEAVIPTDETEEPKMFIKN